MKINELQWLTIPPPLLGLVPHTHFDHTNAVATTVTQLSKLQKVILFGKETRSPLLWQALLSYKNSTIPIHNA